MNDPRLKAIETDLESIDADLSRLSDLEAGIIAGLKAQGYGTPEYRTWEQLKAEIARLEAALAECRGEQVPSEPPDEPDAGWTLLHDLSRVRDWDGILNRAPGSTITDDEGSILLNQPRPGERCEMQLLDDRLTEGVTACYSWDLWIDPSTQLDSSGSGTDTICQQHGNQAGYGGGLTIRASDHMLILRVKGGKRLSSKGAQRYEYESDGKGGSDAEPPEDVECGVVTFGAWHQIIVTARWSKVWDGYVIVTLDDNDAIGVDAVPTMCEPADVQLFRLGWYSSDGPAPKIMRIRNAKVEIR